MRIHILGICGSFMASLAVLARALGHEVSGSDAHAHPPMSDLLARHRIPIRPGYDPAHLDPPPDCVIVGNALARGNPAVEFLLDRDLPFASGPEWLRRHVLGRRRVLAVAGTHGKTTGASLLAWILDQAGLEPGFLIGGIPRNFGVSARLGREPYFVIEADEYDTAFFDKRSKFVHYRPRTLAITNLEYDHADIFPDLDAIMRQFHHLVRTVPGRGLIVRPWGDDNVDAMLARGCWTPSVAYGISGGDLRGEVLSPDGGRFAVRAGAGPRVEIDWPMIGRHNVHNALAALAVARSAGVPVAAAAGALATFAGVERRLERRACIKRITVYDDFAHHPTAIAATLAALRSHVGEARILAVVEPASNTMRMGVQRARLGPALAAADRIWVFERADLAWEVGPALAPLGDRARACDTIHGLVAEIAGSARPGDHIVVMSNGPFAGLHRHLIDALEEQHD